jgi:hypothetical protein
MITSLLHKRLRRFHDWWRAPATRKDRIRGAFIGAVGCFWIGTLGRIMIGPLPVSGSTVGWWALGSIVSGILLGILFPKVVSCVCFPFLTFGPSS